MALTREFKETVQARAAKDVAFRVGLLQESLACYLSGDMTTGKILLRDYINATVGFAGLAKLTNKSAKSLMRMVSAEGNPRADNFFTIIQILQDQEGISFQIEPVPV